MTIRSLLISISLLALLLFSCEDREDTITPIKCSEDALFELDNRSGTMIYIPCYDAWGVLLDESLHEEANTIVASLDINEEYKVKDKVVQLNACLIEFNLPLVLADPAPLGYLYEMDDFSISGR